jgi:hypothetical protein
MEARMKTGRRAFSATVALVLALCGVRQASAAAFRIDDTTDSIVISVCDFEGGMSINGVPMGSCGVGYGGTVSVPESAGLVTFGGSWIDLGSATLGSHTVYFTEGPGSNVVSDILQYTYSRSSSPGLAVLSGSFISDFEDNLGLVPAGAETWDENLGAYRFSNAYLSASATSDPAPVPEPTTLLLVGSGLVALARRPRNKA